MVVEIRGSAATRSGCGTRAQTSVFTRVRARERMQVYISVWLLGCMCVAGGFRDCICGRIEITMYALLVEYLIERMHVCPSSALGNLIEIMVYET